jgi:hypothetical protein
MKRGGTPRVQYRCSFCGKDQEKVHRLIAGPGGVYICNECIDLCREIIEEEQAMKERPAPDGEGAHWVSSSGHVRPTEDRDTFGGDGDARYIDVPKATCRRCPTRAAGSIGGRARGDARLTRAVGARERRAARTATVTRGRARPVSFPLGEGCAPQIAN